MALMRLVMKPGDSLMVTVSLPMLAATSRVAARVASLVSRPRTISTSFILCTGLKKCMPTKRGARVVAAAISVMLREDVLEAKMVSGAQTWSIFENSSILSSMFSGTASMTKSACATAASRSVVVVSRAKAASACSRCTSPRSTAWSRFRWMWPVARCSISSEMSCSTV